MKTVSVCIGLYNGAKYLEKQLASLLNQTRKPDQVILCDDCSTDKTVRIAEKFIAQHNLRGSWHVCRNEKNLGYPGNFYYAMGLCDCDIVFLGDQDDLWAPDKLEKMTKAFEEREEIKVLSCRFSLIDSRDDALQSSVAPDRGRETGELTKVSVDRIFLKYEWPGMVLAYRNDWYRQNTGIGVQSKIPHDFFLCAKAAEEEGFYLLDRVLACHRRHDNNVGGEEHRASRLIRRNRKCTEVRNYLKLLDAFAVEKALKTPAAQRILEKKTCSMEGRLEALQSGKVTRVLKNAFRYRDMVRPETLICDVLICMKKGEKNQ